MKLRAFPLLLSAAMVLTSLACASASPANPAEAAKPAKPELVGPVTRDKVEAAVPEWVQAELESQPDAEAAQALASVEPGAEVTILLGTWCGDSRREVSRFWKALDETGGAVPFEVHYVAVDEDKKEPAAAVAENGVRYLPTFVVRRGGHEVGRIVETSPNGIEKDLLALLTGKAQGLLATREDLTSPAKPPL
jgi:thiol-disulfide isomerase/thioredoxin